MKKILKMVFALTVLSLLWAKPVIAEPYIPEVQFIEVFDEVPVMEKIKGCEGTTQFNDDGTVVRGRVNPQDVGAWQINEFYWLEKSIELGYDIYTADGNKQMAYWIYKHHGTQPWNASRHCWSK